MKMRLSNNPSPQQSEFSEVSESSIQQPITIAAHDRGLHSQVIQHVCKLLATASSDCGLQCSYPSLLPRIISGSIGSIVTALAVTPLEVVKIRQQTATTTTAATTTTLSRTACPSCGTFILNNGLMECVISRNSIPSAGIPKISAPLLRGSAPTSGNGTFAVMRHIFATEGFTGVYAGLAPTLLMSVPNTVMYFTVYDEIKARLELQQQQAMSTSSSSLLFWIPLVAGSSARLVASLATAPLELVRTRQAMMGSTSSSSTSGSGFVGLWSDLKQIVRAEGGAALFKGVGPTLWRDVPFSAIYWFSIERFKLQWKESIEHPTLLQQAGQAFVNGATAGMIAAACTAPFDVVKTRRQTMMNSSPVVSEVEVVLNPCHQIGTTPAYQTHHPQTTFGVMRQVLHDEGLAGLWRGNTTRMIKVAPACAIMISCYELGKVLLEY